MCCWMRANEIEASPPKLVMVYPRKNALRTHARCFSAHLGAIVSPDAMAHCTASASVITPLEWWGMCAMIDAAARDHLCKL